MTSYERAIRIGKSRDADAGMKRKKRKRDKVERVRDNKCPRERCDEKMEIASHRSSLPCDLEPSHDTLHRCCRGWFSPSWSSDLPEHCSTSEQHLLHIMERLAQHAESQLVELECSSAAKWSEFKRSRREETDTLLSSPAGVLWSGDVKPLIQPAQATSVGKRFYKNKICVNITGAL